MEVFETRDEMINWLPKGGCWVELGVFAGEFAKKLYDIGKPDNLILVDLWNDGPQFSGDRDGNNGTHYDGKELQNHVYNMFKDMKNVHIYKNYSSVIMNGLPDNTIDVVYIDADHSYEGCKIDLELAYKKVKPGGWICGHDYLICGDKTKSLYNFGVRRAVNELCKEKNLKIQALGQDGYVSFAIQNTKT